MYQSPIADPPPPAADWFDGLPGERNRVRVASHATGHAYAVMESLLQPGAAVPEHSHRETEVFVVLDGEMTYRVAGETFVRGAGGCLAVPGGVAHAWRNAGDRPARVLAIFSPGTIEPMFREIAGQAQDALVEIAARYGTFVTGPPIE